MKAVILHNGSEEVHMTQPDRFAAEDSGTGLELDGVHLNELRLA